MKLGLIPMLVLAFLSAANAVATGEKELLERISELDAMIENARVLRDEPDESREFVGQVMSGRLTLESGVGVSGSNQAAKSTLYFTTYNGTDVTVYIHNKWKFFALSELSLNLSGLTSGKNYDVFIYSDNTTALNLELSAAWSNDTTRTDSLALQDGVYVKSSDHKRRYLGTIRASSATTTEDTDSQRFVWNYYNRADRTLTVQDTTDSWTCATSYTNVNSSSSNKVELLIGLNEVLTTGTAKLYASAATDDLLVDTGIGVDTTGTNSAWAYGAGTGAAVRDHYAYFSEYLGQGYHALHWLEKCDSNVTAYGDNNGVGGIQSQMDISFKN